MAQDKIVDLLWRLGIGPRMAGFRYIVRCVELARSGADITPELLHLVADEFGVPFSRAYGAMALAKRHSYGYRIRQYEEFMNGYGDSLYDFLYVLSQRL